MNLKKIDINLMNNNNNNNNYIMRLNVIFVCQYHVASLCVKIRMILLKE